MQCRFGRLALLLAAAAVAGCSNSDPDFNSTSAATVPNEWTRLAHDYASTYSNPAETTLTAANVGQLKLDWHFQTAGSANGAAAVADGVVYVLSTGGTYAFEAASGNVLWQNPEVAGTASPAYDHGALFIQMSNARLVALDATTGAERWRATVDANEFASGFSSPIVFERYVIVGSSSIEEAAARRNATFRGGLVAFDRDSGAEIWRFYTADPPYNGVGVWSTASIDTEARIVYGSTGNNYTESAGSIRVRWSG
jgi:outer membrane protein assembly factor BamB